MEKELSHTTISYFMWSNKFVPEPIVFTDYPFYVHTQSSLFRLYRFNALILIYEQQEISCTLTIVLHTLY